MEVSQREELRFGEITVNMMAGSRELNKIEVSGLYITVDSINHVLPVHPPTPLLSRRRQGLQAHGRQSDAL